MAALQVRECGKPWAEADADVCEAIDHIEYAVHQALALAAGKELLQLPGEKNQLRYRPRGVVAAIGPWNFPLAIPAGLVATGLATGNAVILKPAEQAPASGHRLVQALRAAAFLTTSSNCCPATARPARRWSHIPASTRSRSRDRRPWAWRSSAQRPRPHHSQGTSNGSWPRWAARTRSSSTRTPTWIRSCRTSCARRSRSQARSARPRHACWSTKRSRTHS